VGTRRILRVLAASAVVLGVFAPAGGTLPLPTARGAVAAQDQLEQPLLVELNRVRRAHGVASLQLSPALSRAAHLHASSMGVRGYFSHDSADGTSFDRRLAQFYPARATRAWSVGENLLWSTAVSPREAVRMWMASPGHRANILSGRFREIGLGAVRAERAGGHFRGYDVTILVTDFGSR
jgi:uncharacterized protein YkwD